MSGATSLGQTAANVYGTVKGSGSDKTTPPANNSVTQQPVAPSWQKYLPWGIGAALVLVLVLVLPRGGK